MLRFAKAFLDIALCVSPPPSFPASVLLLCLVAAAAACSSDWRAVARAPAGEILTRVALGRAPATRVRVGGAGHRPAAATFLQTGTALLGVAVLAELVLYPLGRC